MQSRNTRRREKGTNKEWEETFESKMTKNFPKWMSGTKPQIQKVSEHTTQDKWSKKQTNNKNTVSFSNYRKSMIKEKFWWKPVGEKHFTYIAANIRITSDFSSETMQVRKDWSKIFK